MTKGFKILESIGEINLSQNIINRIDIKVLEICELQYELYIFSPITRRIFCCRFTLLRALLAKDVTESDARPPEDMSPFKITLWKTLYLPFNIKEVIISKESLWAVGKSSFVDIKSHVKNMFKHNTPGDVEMENDSMEIDDNDDFQFQEFEYNLENDVLHIHELQEEIFPITTNLNDSSFILCWKDTSSMSWHMKLIISDIVSLTKTEVKQIPLPDLSLTYSTENSFLSIESTRGVELKPIITFFHIQEFNNGCSTLSRENILQKLLNSNSSSESNCICLIGHPEGKVLYALCSWIGHQLAFKMDTDLDELFDFKQPVAGIHYFREIEGLTGNGILLIVGTFGKLSFITAEKCFFNSVVFKSKELSFHVTTLNLSSCIHKYLMYKNCLFHISDNGDLCVSEFSKKIKNSPSKETLEILRSPEKMSGVVDLILLSEQNGIFLCVKSDGNIYVTSYTEHMEQTNQLGSLPVLMNEIMHHSTILSKLRTTMDSQYKLFAALSTFSSLKFNSTQNVNVDISVSKSEEPPEKFLIDINIKSSESFDSNFWFVVTSLYSFYEKDSPVTSKTVPFNTDKKIHIEVSQSSLCSPHVSAFPLYLEVGLLLTIPDYLSSMDCYELISKELPIYTRIQTFVLNELYLLKRKQQSSLNKGHSAFDMLRKSEFNQNSNLSENLKTFEGVRRLSFIKTQSLNQPIALLFDIDRSTFKSEYLPQSFTFYLMAAKAEEMVKDLSAESTLTDKIRQIFERRSRLEIISEPCRLICRDQEITLLVCYSNKDIYVTVKTKSFALLAGLRMAAMEVLLNSQCKSVNQIQETSARSKYVCILAQINSECEVLGRKLLSMYGQDVTASGFFDEIVSTYCRLRKVSEMLPFC